MALTRFINEQAILDLVASDFSYKPEFQIAERVDKLQSVPDNVPGSDYGFPPSLVSGLDNALFSRTHRNFIGSGISVVEFDNWIVEKKFEVREDGFGAVVFKSRFADPITSKYDYIVAFRGTDGLNAQDWYANLDLSKEVWARERNLVMPYLLGTGQQEANIDQATLGRIHFTGQSLGGGLAQYAAYDYALSRDQNFRAGDISLITFNAFGGIRGLQQLLGSYNVSLLSGVETAHFVIDNDIVHRLGAGDRSQLAAVGNSWHVNGNDNTYRLDFLQKQTGEFVRDSSGQVLKLNTVAAHRIEAGFYAGFDNFQTSLFDFSRANRMTIDYLDTPNSQSIGAAFSRVFNRGLTTEGSATARVIVGLVAIGIAGERAEIRRLGRALLDAYYASAEVSVWKKALFETYAFPEVIRVAGFSLGRWTMGGLVLATGLELFGVISEFDNALIWDGINSFLPNDRRISRKDLVLGDEIGERERGLMYEIATLALSSRLGPEEIEEILDDPKQREAARVLAGVELDADALLARFASGADWLRESLQYMQTAAVDSGQTGEALVAFDLALVELLNSEKSRLGADDGAFEDKVAQAIKDFLSEDLGRALANTQSEFTNKYILADASAFGATQFDFVAYDQYHDALEQAASNPEFADIAPLLEDALDIVESAGQTVVLSAERTIANPFDVSGFDPDTASLPAEQVGEGNIKRFTLSLPYAAGDGGQRIEVSLDGAAATKVKLLAGAEEVVAQDGVYTVVVEENHRELELVVWGQVDVAENGTLAVSATLVDAAGEATHQTRIEANVEFVARTDRVFEGSPDLSGEGSQTVIVQSGANPDGSGVHIDFQGGDDTVWGDLGEDRLLGGSGNDRLFGSFRVYAGLNDQDWLSGGSGDDQLIGGEGNDTLEGDSGSDILLGDVGNDFLFGGSKADYATIFSVGGSDLDSNTVQGGAGNDLVVGSAGSDALSGGNGDDLVFGGAGNDEIRGDTEFVPTHTFQIIGSTFPPVQPLAPGADVLYGNAGSDRIYGEGGNDLLYGGEGNDTLIAGEGSDGLYGGAGNDALIGDSGGVISGPQGNDFLDGGAGDDQLSGQGGADTLIGGLGNDVLDGGDGGDLYVFTRGDGEDVIVEAGVGGVDVVDVRDYARSEVTVRRLANGSVFLVGESGDTITLSRTTGSIGSGVEFVQFADGTAVDVAALANQPVDPATLAGAGWQTFSVGDDTINTSGLPVDASGFVMVDAGAGNDIVFGSSNAVVYGNDGDDTLLGGDILIGGEGNDLVNGGVFAYGGPGDDRILEGNVLYGGTSDDYLEGGFGASRIVFGAEDSGQDIVTDTRGLSVDELAEWYYPSIGMPDWRSALVDPMTEDRISIEEGIARGALPALPQIAANDFAALAPLYAAGVIELDTVEFAQSLTPDDVDLSLGEAVITSPLSGALEAYVTLDVSWAPGSVARIVIPHAEDPLGTGIEQFRFADGTILGLAQMLERESAGPAPLPTITGTEDTDFLIGTADSEQILGLAGDDYLQGLQGNDMLDGGPGNDFLEGGAGDDTYVFGHGYHVDTGLDDGGVDFVRFAAGIVPEDVGVTRDPYGTLYLVLPATGDRILLVDWFSDPARLIESARFPDGTVWNAAEIQSRVTTLAPTELGDVLTQREGDDAVDGLGGNDEIYGLDGDDVLAGGAGDDTLEGGAGSDILRGGDGADGLADGQGNNYLGGGAGDDVIVAEGAPQFSDGGYSFVVGGAGNDNIYLYASGNVMAFNTGDGQDTVYAAGDLTLSLGGEITPDLLSLSQDGADLVLAMGESDSIRLTRQFEADPSTWPRITLQIFGSVHLYDFNAVIADFQAAIATDASLTALPLDGMLQAHETSVSETHAVGGALAYQYGTVGSLDGVSDEVIRQVLADANFGTAPQSIAIAGGNQAPVVAVPIGDQSAQEDSAFSIAIPAETFSADDAGGTLTFSAALADGSPLPVWLSFDAVAQTFSGTPANEDVGAFDVMVTATDTGGLAASDAFQLTVANTNDAPALEQPLSDQIANQNAPISFLVPQDTFVDADVGDALTLTAQLSDGAGLPSWLGFNPLSGLFSGTPSELDVGDMAIRVTATDAGGTTANDTFALSVSDASTENETHLGTRRRDEIVTGFANDWIDAGGGDDWVRAGAGRDVVLGGRGSDRLEGGAGNDVYIHDRHGGHDLIDEVGGADTLRLGEGIMPNQVRLERRRDNLVVDLKGADGSVTVTDWFASNAAKVETIQFADGTAWGVDEISDRVQRKRSERRRDDDPEHAYPHGRRDDDHHGKPDGRKHDDDAGSRPERKPDRIADLLEAVLARKPRYDFEALEQELDHPQRRGEELDAQEIARRWEVIRRYANGTASERDEDARGGAVHRINEDALAVGLDIGRGDFDTGSSELARGAASLRTLKGIEEGLIRLRG